MFCYVVLASYKANESSDSARLRYSPIEFASVPQSIEYPIGFRKGLYSHNIPRAYGAKTGSEEGNDRVSLTHEGLDLTLLLPIPRLERPEDPGFIKGSPNVVGETGLALPDWLAAEDCPRTV